MTLNSIFNYLFYMTVLHATPIQEMIRLTHIKYSFWLANKRQQPCESQDFVIFKNTQRISTISANCRSSFQYYRWGTVEYYVYLFKWPNYIDRAVKSRFKNLKSHWPQKSLRSCIFQSQPGVHNTNTYVRSEQNTELISIYTLFQIFSRPGGFNMLSDDRRSEQSSLRKVECTKKDVQNTDCVDLRNVTLNTEFFLCDYIDSVCLHEQFL